MGTGRDRGAGGEGHSVGADGKKKKKTTVLAFTKNSMKRLSLQVCFQIYFKLSQKDCMLLEELITVSSTAGTLPFSKVILEKSN